MAKAAFLSALLALIPAPLCAQGALGPWYELVWRINSWRLFKQDPVALEHLGGMDRPVFASIDLDWLDRFKQRVVAGRNGELAGLEREMDAWESAIPESVRNKKALFASIQDLKIYFIGHSGGPLAGQRMRELHRIKVDVVSQGSLDAGELARWRDRLRDWEQAARGDLAPALSDGQKSELTLLLRKNQGLRGDAALKLQGSLSRLRSRTLDVGQENQAQALNKLYDAIALLGVGAAAVPAEGAARPPSGAADPQGVRFLDVPAAALPGQSGAGLAGWVQEWARTKWLHGDVYKRAYRDFQHFYSVASMIARKALSYGIHPLLAFGVVGAESSWNPVDVSRAGAVGLCQVMPFGRSVARLKNPEINAEYGMGELRTDLNYYARRGGVDVETFRSPPSTWSAAAKEVATLALRAYNLGLSGMNRVLAGKKTMPGETRHYPTRVFREMGRLLS